MTDDEIIGAIQVKVARDAKSSVHPVAAESEIAEVERILGFSLPRFYVRILTEVGNGGFGPGYGIIGIPPRGFQDSDLGTSLIDAYLERSVLGDDRWRLPKGLLPLCNWGCACFSYVDCMNKEASVVTDHVLETGVEYVATSARLADWLADWARGTDLWQEMHDVTAYRDGINPFTRKPHRFKIRRLKGVRLDFSGRD
jgi:hypothetical protein